MIRVKDATALLAFYRDVMGIDLKQTLENKNGGFTLYFLGYGAPAPNTIVNGVNPIANCEGLLELR